MSTKKLQIIGSLGDKIYKQNEAPTDAEEGDLWLDMDEENDGGFGSDIDSTLTHEGKAADAKAVGDALARKQPVGNYATESYVNTAVDAVVIPTKISELTNDSGFLTSYAETDPTVPAWAKTSTKPSYTASEVGAAPASHGNHVPATETANNAKFLRNDNTWQTVTPANIGAAASSHGTHVSYSTTAPVMDGTASAGSASTVARSDHKHPTDTSRASASDLTALQALVGDTAVSTQISNAISPLSSEIANLKASTETWTFTLEDGSTVTKKVVVQ